MFVPSEQTQQLQQAPQNELFLYEMPHKQKYFQTHIQNKNEEDFDLIQITSPSQNIGNNESNYDQTDKKKCPNCIALERKNQDISHQLQHEKKKNLKYLKIMNTKIEKEKQLQAAYYQIAKQLKKRMDATIQSGDQLSVNNKQKCEGNNQEKCYFDQSEHLRSLQELLAQKMELIKALTEKINNQSIYSSSSLLEGKKKKISLDRNLNNATIVSKAPKMGTNLSIFHYPISVESIPHQQQFEDAKSDANLCEQQTSEQKCLNKRRQEKDSIIVQNYILDREMSKIKFECNQDVEAKEQQSGGQGQQKQYKTVNQFQQPDSFRSIHTDRPSAMFLQEISVLDQTNRQERQSHGGRGSQFYSIPEEQLSIGEISNVSIKQSFSHQSNNRVSEKQILDKFDQCISGQMIKARPKYESFTIQKQIQQQIQSQTSQKTKNLICQKEKISTFTSSIKHFFEILIPKLNFQGQKFKISCQLPKDLIDFVPFDSENSLRPVEGEATQKKHFEEALKLILMQLQNIFKNQRKQYERRLNDRLLEISDIENKYDELNIEKKKLQKIIESYQIHKSLMEIKLLELQERQLYSKDSKKSLKSLELIQSHKKKISSMKQQNTRNIQVQCCILPSDIMETFRKASSKNGELVDIVNSIPHILNNLDPTTDTKQACTINFDQKVKEQLEAIIKDAFEFLLLKNQSLEKENIMRRVRSSSYCINSSVKRKDSEGSLAMQLLEAENQQLRQSLKQKSEEFLKLSEKNTLQNIEKSNCDKMIENLNIEIYSLKNELKGRQTASLKVDSRESIGSALTPIKQSAQRHSEQFLEYEDKKEYNNMYWDRDEEVKELKQKLAMSEQLLKKYSLQHKRKKKIIYINN